MEKKLPALLFDGNCTLCVRFKGSLEKTSEFFDLNFYDINDPKTFELFDNISAADATATLHLVDQDQQIHVAEKAVEWLLKKNEKVKDWLWLIDSKMGQKALEFFYNQTNKLRKQLKNNCLGCNNRHDHSL